MKRRTLRPRADHRDVRRQDDVVYDNPQGVLPIRLYRGNASAAGARQTRRCAERGAANAFDFQHGLGEFAHGGVRNFRREQLREAAFHFVHCGRFRFAKAEELAVAAADDGQELLFLPAVRLTHEHDHFAPIQSLGRRFGFIELFAGRGELGPCFECHDDGCRCVRDAHEAGIGREVVLCAIVGK